MQFENIQKPVINADGDVAFVASLKGVGIDASNRGGLWITVGGMLQNIVRTGDLFDVDSGPGEDLRTISDIRFEAGSNREDGQAMTFNNAGQIVFRLQFTDGSEGIFITAPKGIPEPGTISLLLMSLAFAGSRRRRPCAH